LQKAVHQRRIDQLARSQAGQDPYREVARRERLPVDLGEQTFSGKSNDPTVMTALGRPAGPAAEET
jgi:hypothetical protein